MKPVGGGGAGENNWMMTISVYRRMTWRDDMWTVKTYERWMNELWEGQGTVWFPEVTFKLMF